MAARTKARKRALDLLFEAEQRGVNAADLLRERLAAPVTEAPLSEFTADLVMGVVEHWGQVDELIATYSQGWTLERMPAVDRAILRLGAYEVLFSTDVPEPVAISEWVGLATELSTDDSPRFVNGLLARLAEVKPTLASSRPADRASRACGAIGGARSPRECPRGPWCAERRPSTTGAPRSPARYGPPVACTVDNRAGRRRAPPRDSPGSPRTPRRASTAAHSSRRKPSLRPTW